MCLINWERHATQKAKIEIIYEGPKVEEHTFSSLLFIQLGLFSDTLHV